MKQKGLLLTLLTLFCYVAAVSAADYVVPENNGIYRIVNLRYNKAMAEDFIGANMICDEIGSDDSYTQLWQFSKSGTGWNIRNVYTGNYIKNAGAFYIQVQTISTPTTYYLTPNSVSKNAYNLWHNTSQSYTLHCDGGFNIVPWYRGSGEVTASEWGFVKVELSDSVIAVARAQYAADKNIIDNGDALCEGYMAFFEDAACTRLKAEYASMGDDELRAAMKDFGAVLADAAVKIKNDSWAEYEKFFRVHRYEPYSDVDVWANRLIMTTYSYMSNPTGIYANSGDIVYMFVGDDIPENATLEVDRIYLNSHKGVRSELKKGMNIIPVGRGNSMLYVIYTVDTTGDKVLADYDSLDIHIEGGILNGYWDRDFHTDADWVKITKNLATYEYIQVKGNKVILNMDKDVLTASNCVPEKITECIGWWDQIATWQHEAMGFYMDGTNERFNNLHMARSVPDAGTMSSGSYNTNYPPSSLPNFMAYEKMMHGCHFWGPAHEIGHANQGAINLISCTEVSNNLFSNIVQYKFGRYMSRGDRVSDVISCYENKIPFTLHPNIWSKTRMYWQLYLYYHVAGNNPEFFQRLFIALREDPLRKGTSHDYGNRDLLKFAEKCCEASGEDMTSFFEAWGFFIPMNRVVVEDYATYTLTSTQSMINATKEKMAQYPKKCGAIEFIEDRIAHSPRMDGVEGNRLVIDHNVGEAGDVGQYTAYMADSMKTKASGYLYSKFGREVTFSKGNGAVGFRFYNTEDSLLTFCNTYKYVLPENVASRELKIVAVSADGTESEVVSVYNGDEEDQLAALNSALEQALQYVRRKDTTGKKVGYFHAYAVEKLSEYYTVAKAAVTNADQSEYTYGEWAKLIAAEFDAILADENAVVKLNPKNAYKFTNAQYTKYTITCDNNGVLSCAMTSNKQTRFYFIPVANSDLYYIKNYNGKYVDYVEQSRDITAKASSTSSALKFKLYDLANGKFEIQHENSGYGYFHSASNYKLVGWSAGIAPSQWTITCVEDNVSSENKTALQEAVAEAVSQLDFVVDSVKSTDGNIVFNEYIEITNEKLPEYVAQLATELEAAEALIATRPAVFFPEQTDKLYAAIDLVKASYSILTAIKDITIDAIDGAAVVYDLRGRRVDVVTPGRIYIVDGCKVRVSR